MARIGGGGGKVVQGRDLYLEKVGTGEGAGPQAFRPLGAHRRVEIVGIDLEGFGHAFIVGLGGRDAP